MSIKNVNHLTPRMTDVLKGIALGKTTYAIAYDLKISMRTVEHYRQSIMNFTRIRSVAELTHYALAKGFVKNIYL